MARRRKEIGIRIKRGKYQAFAEIAGEFHSATFPFTEDGRKEARDWRAREIETFGGGSRGEAGTLAGDIERYGAKPEVKAMPSYQQRMAHLALWAAELGHDRRRATIVRDDIEAVLQQWLAAGLSPVTVYHRRTALGRLWRVLDGEDAPNPVHGTTRPDHYRPTDRSVPRARVEAILAAMPSERYVKKGIRQPSIAALVARAIAETGIPPAELVKLHRRDLDRDRQVVHMPWRDKGAGTPAHVRELSATGVAALEALFVAAPHGRPTFAEAAVAHSFKRAARRVCGPDTAISLYWLRHALGADLYRTTRDLATVGRLLGHAVHSPVTGRYAMGAHAAVDRAAWAALDVARAAASGPKTGDSLPATLPAPRKRQKKERLRRVS